MERLDGTYREPNLFEHIRFLFYSAKAMIKVCHGRFYTCRDLPDDMVEYLHDLHETYDEDRTRPEVGELLSDAALEFSLRKGKYEREPNVV